jgi:hypothetical protein
LKFLEKGIPIMFAKDSLRLKIAVLIVAAAGLAGAAAIATNVNPQKITLKGCPPVVQATIAAKIGKTSIVTIEKSGGDDDVEYAVSIMQGGKARVLCVAETGEFLVWKEQVQAKDCSAPVQKTINEKTVTARVLRILKETTDNGSEYTVTVEQEDEDRDFYVAEDGGFLCWDSFEVELKDCPLAVQRKIQELSVGTTIELIEDSVEEFTAKLKKGPRERTICVLANGTLRAWQDKVTVPDCPLPVQTTIKAKAGNATITEICKEAEGPIISYTVTIETDDDERIFTVAADGKFLGWDDE